MPAKTTDRSTTANKMPTKLRLKIANECDNISSKVKLTTLKKEYKFFILHSSLVDELHFNKMMSLFEPLMREMYENSNWGWDKEEKLSEWKHKRTRIILVLNRDASDYVDEKVVYNQLPPEEEELVGFMCFRFETGSDKSESALYVYELHIHPDCQRQGLGEELMRMARAIATTFRMDKIMLTVFRSNAIALNFYNDKMKFSTDKSTPAKNEADYVILSCKLKY